MKDAYVAAYVMCLGADAEEGLRAVIACTRPDRLGPILVAPGTGTLLGCARLALLYETRLLCLESHACGPSSWRGTSFAHRNQRIVASALLTSATHMIETLYYGPFGSSSHDPGQTPGFEALRAAHTETSPVALRALAQHVREEA